MYLDRIKYLLPGNVLWKEQGINKEERKDFKKQLRKTKILSVPRVSLIFTFMWF